MVNILSKTLLYLEQGLTPYLKEGFFHSESLYLSLYCLFVHTAHTGLINV